MRWRFNINWQDGGAYLSMFSYETYEMASDMAKEVVEVTDTATVVTLYKVHEDESSYDVNARSKAAVPSASDAPVLHS